MSARTRRSIDGRMAAFTGEHGARVTAWLRRFGVPEGDLADARQEVWLAAFRHFEQLGPPDQQRGWLYTVCRRTAKDLRRRAYRRHERPGLPHTGAVEADQASRAEARARLAAVARAAAGLSEVQREVWLAHSLERASTDALAARLGCPPKTIFSRLYAARAHLRRKLAEDGWLAGWLAGPFGRLGGATAPSAAGSAVVTLATVVVVVAALAGGQPVSPARLAGCDRSSPEVRRVGYVALAGSERPAPPRIAAVVDRLAPATVPHMHFDVLDVAAPQAALGLQQTELLDFEPVVVAGSGDAPEPKRTVVVTHPPDIKPALSRPYRLSKHGR